MEILRLKASDYEEACDLLNLVFSQAYAPTTFEKMLPLLYQPTDEHMGHTFAVRENGRLRATVGLFPAQIKAGEHTLLLGGIGGVSSHPNDRGMGWMKLLMNHCIEEMQNTDTDLSFLIGLRQRYQYFGYEKAGTMVEHTLSATNFRHVPQPRELAEIRFVPLAAADTEQIAKAKELYDRQPFRCVRSEAEFYLYLVSLHAEPWVALYPDGSVAGYLVCNQKRTSITEIFAQDDAAFRVMLRSWFAQQKISESTVILPPWQVNQARYLNGIAEGYRLADNGNWRFFHWEKVIAALLWVKQSISPLLDGELTIGVKEYGAFHITVRGSSIACAKTAVAPAVEWDAFIATRVLFGHFPALWVTAVPETARMLLADWFPLPLHWLPQNYV